MDWEPNHLWAVGPSTGCFPFSTGGFPFSSELVVYSHTDMSPFLLFHSPTCILLNKLAPKVLVTVHEVISLLGIERYSWCPDDFSPLFVGFSQILLKNNIHTEEYTNHKHRAYWIFTTWSNCVTSIHIIKLNISASQNLLYSLLINTTKK